MNLPGLPGGLHRIASLFSVAILLFSGILPLAGQDVGAIRREIEESRSRLEEVRRERASLQGRMESLRSRSRDLSGELRNVERQISASRSVMAEVEMQLDAGLVQAEDATRELLIAGERLKERTAIHHRRLRDIYKRGPVHALRVLLTADSFTGLIARYRYLSELSRYDRLLVDQVAELELELEERRRTLETSRAELGNLRREQLEEVAALRQLELLHQETLDSYRSQERQAQSRLDRLEEDERRLAGTMEELDRRRREIEARAAAAGAAPVMVTMAAGDRGNLPWPLEGPLVYRFGRETRPNGTVLRWNGIGIRGDPGTPVRAVRAGTVVLAGPFEGYGPTVILSHGEGYYTLYLYLDRLSVVEGRTIGMNEVVGTVGGEATPEGARLEFQLRVPGNDGTPAAVDPLLWLRPGGEE